jgi:small nuclear ribonucleoprotein (snRNP)-like protein
VKALKDLLRVQDNSAAEITHWLDKPIEITTTSGAAYTGILRWVDKYNLGIDIAGKMNIMPKANIERIQEAADG